MQLISVVEYRRLGQSLGPILKVKAVQEEYRPEGVYFIIRAMV